MSGTSYFRLARACESIKGLSGRKDKVAQIVKLLQELEPDEVAPAILLLIGRVAPEGDEDKLEIGAAAVYQLLEEFKQTTLLAVEPPTILEVWNKLREISRLRGAGSRERKLAVLRGLIARMSDLEKQWFLKQLMGEMQHGVNEGLVLEAVVELTGASLEDVQRAFMLVGRIGDFVELAVRGGGDAIKSARLQVFRPVRPMLAEMCHDLEQLMKEFDKPMSFEYKFDGARVQIHVKNDEVRIFSRRLSDVTRSLPDIVQFVKEFSSRFSEIVLDGEVVAVDETRKPMPFQELLRRFRRLKEIEEEVEKIPLKLWIFDILYLNGRELLDTPYQERRELLEKLIPEEHLAPRIVTSNIKKVQAFMRKALEEGHEGLMAKSLESPYRPGRRERLWLKIKPAETLDLVIVAADWGHGRRTGWLSNYHLAAYNPENGKFEVVGKTFKGLTDEEFEWITKRLLELGISDDGYTVTVRPRIVVEVAYNEIQRSPKYQSGYALRFARITRIRTDKAPEEADTIQRIKELYERQFERKRLPKELIIWRLRRESG